MTAGRDGPSSDDGAKSRSHRSPVGQGQARAGLPGVLGEDPKILKTDGDRGAGSKQGKAHIAVFSRRHIVKCYGLGIEPRTIV